MMETYFRVHIFYIDFFENNTKKMVWIYLIQAGGKAIEDLKSQVAILQKELQSLREIKYQVLALQKEQKSMKELRAKEGRYITILYLRMLIR